MGWSPVVSQAPTPSVQSRGLGSGHFSCSSVWFTPTRGPSKDLTLWVHPWGKVASPTPPCPEVLPTRPHTRSSIAPAWPPCPPAPWACPIRRDIPGGDGGQGSRVCPFLCSASHASACHQRALSPHSSPSLALSPQRQGAGRRGPPHSLTCVLMRMAPMEGISK